jgi:hypothetical protein
MDSTTRHARTAGARVRAALAVSVLSIAIGGVSAGCGSGSAMTPNDPAAAAPAVEAAMPAGTMTRPAAEEMRTAWAARPEYVKALPAAGQEAYKFALARPDVLQWLPCYCGCAGMQHRSNLDCFFQRRELKGTYAYEQHASFCDVCVQTANLASDLLRQGNTITQIRAAVDARFGGGTAPGTDTPLPPSI